MIPFSECKSRYQLIACVVLGLVALATPSWITGPNGNAGMLKLCNNNECQWLPRSVPSLDLARAALFTGVAMASIALVTCGMSGAAGVVHRTCKLLVSPAFGMAVSVGSGMRSKIEIKYGYSFYSAVLAIPIGAMAIVV